MECERVRGELKAALERRGIKSDPVIKELGGLKDVEQKLVSLERMGNELQIKVITLQQERDKLEERLMRGAPFSVTAEVERRQNLELKEELSRLSCEKEESCQENIRLKQQLEEREHLCISLQEQLKEFLEPSGTINICGDSILGSSLQNKTDIEKAGEDLDMKKIAVTYNKASQTDKTPDARKRENNSRSRSRDKEKAEVQTLMQKVKTLQDQVKKLETENLKLTEKSLHASNDSSSDEEDPSQPSIKHKPPQKVKTLERQLKVLHSENIRLADKLGGYSSSARLDPEEVIERIVELEDMCSDLQDRVHEAEGHDRQTREKLRVAEQTINELELSEAQYRDKCDDMAQSERETKKQLHSLQTTGRELREIILDKDVLEQALKEKVEFLEKVEAQSSQHIAELEAVEKSLRDQLESRDASNTDSHHRDLKEKLATAEQEIRTLRERNSELEENEEILRENWRRVADEDANRLICLEEKVRILELMNQDLKKKVTEAQDFVVISSAPTQGSLADELSASKRTQARPHSDSPIPGGSDEDGGEDSPKKKVIKLKRQLSLLEEEKNGKIANLQERLATMREDEIKLSETLAEMEMTERELKAKLALYESSEVTVEKMLKYQDKIHELRTSQESLLDQLETMETQEETLQEKLEETERRLKGKIVTLEVEMKTLKQKENKAKARVRELEKHEEELTEKTKKQEEKENGLYIRISGLMDQLKELKTKISEQDKKLAEKDERCRKVASLEAKFLQIEGAYRDKVTSLETSLEQVEARLVEEEQSHADTKQALEQQGSSCDKQINQRMHMLEEMFSQKEREMNKTIASLEKDVTDRDRTISQHDKLLGDRDDRIAQLNRELSDRDSTIRDLETEASSKLSETHHFEKRLSMKEEQICALENNLKQKDEQISTLENDLRNFESQISELENKVYNFEKDLSEKDSTISNLDKNLSEKVVYITALQSDLGSKESRIAEVEKDRNEHDMLKGTLAEKDSQISELEGKLSEKVSHISELELRLGDKQSLVHGLEQEISERETKISNLEKELNERVSYISQIERDNAENRTNVREMAKDISEKDFQICSLKTELSQKDVRVNHLESKLNQTENQIQDLEAKLSARERDLSSKLEEAHQNIRSKDAHVAQMEEKIIHMSSAISQLEEKVAERDSHISSQKAELSDKDTVLSQHVTQLQSKIQTEQKSSTKVSSLEQEVVTLKSQLSQSNANSTECSRKLALVEQELEGERMNMKTLEEHCETLQAERDQLCANVTKKVSDLETQLKQQDMDFQSRMSVRESEFHQACSSLDTECESLRRELTEKDTVIEKLESTKNDLLSKLENLKDREKDLANKVLVLEEQRESESKDLLLSWENRLKDAEDEKEISVKRALTLEAELSTSHDTIQQQTEEIAKLEERLEKAKSEVLTLQDRLSQVQHQEEENSTKVEVFLQQEAMLKSKVSAVETQLEASRRDQETHHTTVSDLVSQKQKLEESLQKVKADLSDSYVMNAKLQETVSELTAHTKTLQQQVADFHHRVSDHEGHQKREKDTLLTLEQERKLMKDLESQIGQLKDEKLSALAEVSKLQKELDLSRETSVKLESQISALGQVEDSLKSQILAEQSSRKEASQRLNQASEEAAVSQERMVQLQQQEAAFQERECVLQDKVASMENQMGRYQEDHSLMCQKLQELEKREKELLEQMTDIEQNVIVPLEAENAELKEDLSSMKQQNEALNLQVDKQEEQAGEDSLELDSLQRTVNELQLARTETQTKLDFVLQELNKQESENERLQHAIVDLEAENNNLEDLLDTRQAEVNTLEAKLTRDMCSRNTQTDQDMQESETELEQLRQKLSLLQDVESTFMSKIDHLEKREVELSEELNLTKSQLQVKHQVHTSQQTESSGDVSSSDRQSKDTVDAPLNQESNGAKVPELFARVQELEVVNQRLTSSLEQATANQTDKKHLIDKLKLAEETEDRLMEKVLEYEEMEISLSTQLERLRHRANKADELEEEVSVLLQQEDDWKEKVTTLTSENYLLSEKLESLQSQVASEQSKNEKITFQIETEHRQLQDTQTELKHVQTKLQAVRSEYEEKLSALEESEKQIEKQLDSQSQRESDLRRELQVLREDMEDVCERYKELEQENSSLKQDLFKLQSKPQEEERPQLAGGVSREPTLQAAQAHTQQSVAPKTSSHQSSASPQSSSPPPRVCSNLTVQMMPLSQEGAQNIKTSDASLKSRITQLEKELGEARSQRQGGGVQDTQGSGVSCQDQAASGSSHVQPASVKTVKILTLHDALEENASLKAQLQHLTSVQSLPNQLSSSEGSDRKSSRDQQSGLTHQLQGEVSRLEARVAELEQSVKEAEGAVQEVVTVVRTRSVHTLEQKIETIQHTIHTQSPAWSLHQELLELLTSQADLQKQVSYLMETEHNLRSALKQAEDELSRARSGSGSSLGARRFDTDKRFSIQSRLSRFGGGISSAKVQVDSSSKTTADNGSKAKEQWLERQVADLQLAKSNLERRLHEAERRLAFRPRPTSASRDELLFRIEQLQGEQGEWRKKVEDLEALNSHYLKEKIELASEKKSLEQKLQTQIPGSSKEVSSVFLGGRREEPLGRSGSVSEDPSSDPDLDGSMLDKPEDVLQKRIKELENSESYLRQQLNEMESDREQLHEIARKDKAMIHEQNVRIRELLLQERNLRSQLSALEDSERSLYNRSNELEDNVSRLEDRVHELEVHERRLRELVRKLKLDEEVWLSKSGDLTASMEQLSSSEISLRKMVQDLQIEKRGLTERNEYLEHRVKELEAHDKAIVQRLKNYENVEASLQNRLHNTENSEVAAHSKASELDVINMDLSSRLQRAVEENAVLSQHVAQQQGQIHEMDRKLSAATDAHVGLCQHVESLQKSEASLQKKKREYELRDIDAQARVRELEQTEEILKDKVNQLQRSENRLKSRLVEFETVGSEMLESMPPAQKQQLPQKLEECQKRVVVLQHQLEVAQAELRRPKTAEDDATSVKVPTAALTEMRSKVALLGEAEYQMSELEKLNAQLTDNILQLRQGKGSCGHEVELEVLRRRLHSYQNTVQELKHHLSEGQVPSLGAADQGQGPESEDLPARRLQCLESERVLHSVRSLTQPPGLSHPHDTPGQAPSGILQSGRALGTAPVSGEPEEDHWRRVEERRRSQQETEQRGASVSMPHASATTSTAHPRQEELIIGLSLPSESERGSFLSQNDTDSEKSGLTHPHLKMVGSTTHRDSTSVSARAPGVVPAPRGSGRSETRTPPMPTSRPPTATNTAFAHQQQHHRSNAGFVTDDSFYLPSSAQSGSESQEEGEAPPLPSSAPPGAVMSAPPSLPQPHTPSTSEKTFVSSVSLGNVGQKGGKGVEEGEEARGMKGRVQTTPVEPPQASVVGLSIRQRIAQIEKQLKENPSPKTGSRAEDGDMFTWKAKATENARLLGAAERESKQLKEDINKLEKDLEEKRRYINIFEKWILDAEEVLKNKNKKSDRDLVQQLQTEVKELKGDLGNAGYRKDDIFTDPAALRTELDHRDRELNAKRSELESLAEETERWREECSNIERMRKNALDSLRMLETEVTQLQDADIQLKQMKDEYNTLRGQYDEVEAQKNKAVSGVHTLRSKVSRLVKTCQEKDELLRRLAEELRGGRGRSSSLLEELTRLETVAAGEEYNRPLSPLDLITGPPLSETEKMLSERIPQATFTRWPSSSSLGDPRDLSSSADLLQGVDRSSLRRPKSADQTKRGRQGSALSKQVSGTGVGSSFAGDTLCVAILGYEPDAASRSGHPHLELTLKEGDQVRVLGPVDRHGYCEGEVGGQKGLVPASHLYPLTDTSATYRPANQPPPRHKKSGGDSADQIVQMFNELQDARLMSGPLSAQPSHNSQHTAHSTATQTRQRRSVSKSSTAPEPPSNLHIQEVDGNSLVLAWQPPTFDQHGLSNGCKVVGYRIYLNGRVCQQPHNPKLARTRIEGLRHDRPQQLGVQTLAASGQVSARAELVYQGGWGGGGGGGGSHAGGDGEMDTDLSSVLNSIQYKTGRKRTVMGLYDYDPEKQSPGDYRACELAFHAGDILLVYGEARQDGFYHGERNGQRGLVPACFVEPVEHGAKSSRKPSAANGSSSPRS